MTKKTLLEEILSDLQTNGIKLSFSPLGLLKAILSYRFPSIVMIRVVVNDLFLLSSISRIAARQGQISLYKLLGWVYLHQKMRAKALSIYVRGFIDTGSGEMIIRAAGVFLPRSSFQLLKRLQCI